MLTGPLLTDALRTLRNKNQLERREGTWSTEVVSEALRTPGLCSKGSANRISCRIGHGV